MESCTEVAEARGTPSPRPHGITFFLLAYLAWLGSYVLPVIRTSMFSGYPWVCINSKKEGAGDRHKGLPSHDHYKKNE